MKRRTFLKSVIALVAMPSLSNVQAIPSLPKVKAVSEAIYTAKTLVYNIRMKALIELGEWIVEQMDEDFITALGRMA